MPLHVIPIEHKFGIISQTHKKQLQDRLIKKRQSLEKELKLKKERNEKYDIVFLPDRFSYFILKIIADTMFR
jgi:hypothetical protein